MVTRAKAKASQVQPVTVRRIIDDRGNVMTHRHTQKGTRRYYYYTSRAFMEGRSHSANGFHSLRNLRVVL
jgi:hypothetical protein